MCHDRKERNNYYSQSGYLCERSGEQWERLSHYFVRSLLVLFAKKKKVWEKRFRENNLYTIILCLNLFVNYFIGMITVFAL